MKVTVIKRTVKLGTHSKNWIVYKIDDKIELDNASEVLKKLFKKQGNLYQYIGIDSKIANKLNLHPDDEQFSDTSCTGFKRFMNYLKLDEERILHEFLEDKLKEKFRKKDEIICEYALNLENKNED